MFIKGYIILYIARIFSSSEVVEPHNNPSKVRLAVALQGEAKCQERLWALNLLNLVALPHFNTVLSIHPERLPFVQKFRWKISVKWYWYFFGTDNRNGTELYHLQNTGKFFKQMVQKISVVSVRTGKGNTSKGITFFPENFHEDEPFHLNSPRNFRFFHTNGMRSCISFTKSRKPVKGFVYYCFWINPVEILG